MWCANVEEGDEHTVPAMNVFQRGAGGAVFGLLRAELRTQEQLWSYWGAYGLRLSPALRGLLDGVLHPLPAFRFSLSQAFEWMDAHPDLFRDAAR